MKHLVTISTDSLRICDGKEIEAKSSMEALLAALHHETSTYEHLKDLPMAMLRVEVTPQLRPCGELYILPLSLNQEAGNC